MNYFDWRSMGECRHHDPELWVREKRSDKKKDAEAIRLCNNVCPVKKQCHEYAQTHLVIGIWAGVKYPIRRLVQKAPPTDYNGHTYRQR